MRGDTRREVEVPLFAVRLLRLEEDAPFFSVPLAFIAFYVYGIFRHLAIVYGKYGGGPYGNTPSCLYIGRACMKTMKKELPTAMNNANATPALTSQEGSLYVFQRTAARRSMPRTV